MPRISKTEAGIGVDEPTIEGRYAGLGGRTDFRCRCPQQGVVRSGRTVFRHPGGAHRDVELTNPGA